MESGCFVIRNLQLISADSGSNTACAMLQHAASDSGVLDLYTNGSTAKFNHRQHRPDKCSLLIPENLKFSI